MLKLIKDFEIDAYNFDFRTKEKALSENRSINNSDLILPVDEDEIGKHSDLSEIEKDSENRGSLS